MSAPIVELKIPKGKTFEFVMRYASKQNRWLEIGAVPSLLPVRITVTAHGLPDGWPFTISHVNAPSELNGTYTATVIDPDTIEINDLIGYGWANTWDSTGIVSYKIPEDITGWTARAMFRKRIKDTETTLTFDTQAGVADGLFLVDPVESSFTLTLDAAVAETLEPGSGVWDAEAIDPAGKVYPLVSVSPYEFTNEVTR